MLGEVAGFPPRILFLAALSAAGIACGSARGSGASLSSASPPVVSIPTEDQAPALAPTEGRAAIARSAQPTGAPIAWMSSERDARDRARRQNLSLLIYVRADWAAACLEMERTAWLDPRVGAATRPFVALRLDVTEAEGDAELYAQRYGVNGVPEILVIDPLGRTVARSAGARSADALVSLLRDAAGE
ncbi:MAG: thioredoxin family protein [Byssovorax sp.]